MTLIGWRAALSRGVSGWRGSDVTAMISDSSPEARGQVLPQVHPADDGVMRGRDAERQVVRGLLRRAQRGLGGVVLVAGEPGIGKSRLLREATDEAAGPGCSRAAGAAGHPSP